MDKAEKLRGIVVRLADVDAASVVNGFSLNHRALQGSAGRAKLDAIVRRELGMKCAAVYSAKTYAELEGAILGTTVETQNTKHETRATEEAKDTKRETRNAKRETGRELRSRAG